MGYSSFHQAIPEATPLYRLIAEDEEALSLLAAFWPQGSRPLDLREAWADGELDGVIEDHAGDRGISPDAARQAFGRLEVAIRRSVERHPGLVDRTSFLQKSHEQVREWIEARCRAIGHLEGTRLADQVLFGDSPFGPFGRLGSALIGEAAAFFGHPEVSGPIESAANLFDHPEQIRSVEDDWEMVNDEIRPLADLIAQAHALGEIILVSGG